MTGFDETVPPTDDPADDENAATTSDTDAARTIDSEEGASPERDA